MEGVDFKKEFVEIKTTESNTFVKQHIKSWDLATYFIQTNKNLIISSKFGGNIAILDLSSPGVQRTLYLFRGDGLHLNEITNLKIENEIILFKFNMKEQVVILTKKGELFILQKVNQKELKKLIISPVY